MEAIRALVRDALLLPTPVRRAMRLALRSGWYTIEPKSWESATGVCPLVAAGKLFGYWRHGHLADGGPEWGSEEQPADALMDFAVSFDLCAEELGTEVALGVVLDALERRASAASGSLKAA